MANKNDELLKRLLATFRVEADEHLKAMTSGLLALENTPHGDDATAIIETVFREAHSLKGAARAVNLSAIEALCQALESVFAALKKQRLEVNTPLLDMLHKSIDQLASLLTAEANASTTLSPDISQRIAQLDDVANGVSVASQSTTMPPAGDTPTVAVAMSTPPAQAAAPLQAVTTTSVMVGGGTGTVRVATARLDTVMRQVEELLSPRLAARQRALELHEAASSLATWKKARVQLQPSLRLIERVATHSGAGDTGNTTLYQHKELQKVLEYLDREHLLLANIEDRLTKLNKAAVRDQRMLTTMTDSLLQDVKEMQLMPFAALFELLPRLVRDLAHEQGKQVELVIQGGEVELDRRILDELKDPLVHLLRNAVDHGIEAQAERTAANKPAHGTITLTVSQHDSGKVELRVSDDGAGIDAERVMASARKLGILSAGQDERLGERETLSLAFQSGVTTSPIITDVSGRGLGLAIVREKVERLGGSVTIESRRGAGTAFHIVLPVTLATFRGILVRTGARLCVIPAAGVERVARIAIKDVRTVENRDTVVIDDTVVSLVDLGNVLELPAPPAAEAQLHTPVVVLGQHPARVAFRVDEILGEQEILVKNLGPQLPRVRNVAGASMLGTGQVVPVLNIADLQKSAIGRVGLPRVATGTAQPVAGEQHAILVAEDSITARSLLKSILESAGFAVTTAVDGMDALTTLKTGAFDLLVSDVEMPRMDGFDLTARVRGDKKLAELPVVLVTALESREHRERGIDVGANAYIVKSSFDQSNLLEIINRLL